MACGEPGPYRMNDVGYLERVDGRREPCQTCGRCPDCGSSGYVRPLGPYEVPSIQWVPWVGPNTTGSPFVNTAGPRTTTDGR